MNDRTMIVLVLSALSLGAGILYFERPVGRRESAASDDRRVFPGIDRTNIQEIVLTSGGKVVALRRAGGTWLMKEPAEDRTDPRQVEALVSLLTELTQAARPIESRGGRVVRLAEYGLETPSEKITVRYGDNRDAVTLNFGTAVQDAFGGLPAGDSAAAPAGSTATTAAAATAATTPAEAAPASGLGRVHASLNGETDRVLIVSNELHRMVAAVGRDVNYYRSRQFFEAAALAKVRSLEMLRLVADKDDDPEAANKLESFLTLDLDRPIGSPLGWEMAGRDAGTLAAAAKLGGIAPARAVIRDRADPARVEGILRVLSELRIEQFDDIKEAKMFGAASGLRMAVGEDAEAKFARFGLGADAPKLQIALYDPDAPRVLVQNGRGELVTQQVPVAAITVSRVPVRGRPDLVYAKRSRADGRSDDAVYTLRRDFLDRLPKSVDELRLGTVLPPTANAVRSVTIRRPGVNVELRGETDNVLRQITWKMGPKGSEQVADPAPINDLVAALAEAKVAEYVDWPDIRAERGAFTKPGAITLEMTALIRPDPSKKDEKKDTQADGEKKDEPKKDEPKSQKDEDTGDEIVTLVAAFAPLPAPKADEEGHSHDKRDGKPDKKPEDKQANLAAVMLGYKAARGETRWDGTVRLIPADKLDALRRTRLELYHRNLNVAEPTEVVGMTLARGEKETFELENRAKPGDWQGEWWVKSPYSARADGEVSNWPNQWGRPDETRLLKTVADSAAADALYGLDKPAFTLTLHVRKPVPPGKKGKDKDAEPKTEKKTWLFGKAGKPKPKDVGPRPDAVGPVPDAPAPKPEPAKPEEIHWYARLSDSPLIFEVPAFVADSLGGEVRDRRVADFGPAEKAFEIAVSGPSGAYTLIRTEKDGPAPEGAPPGTPAAKIETFEVRIGESGKPEPVHPTRRTDAADLFGKFSGLPGDFKALRLERYLRHDAKPEELEKLGLDKPEFTFTVSARNGDDPDPKKAKVAKREWKIGREVALEAADAAAAGVGEGRKVRLVRRSDGNAVFLLSADDLSALTRPVADYLSERPGKPEKDPLKP
jgi:hypothetical protein